MSDSLSHLQAHHGDFSRFRDVMIETAVGRFGPIWTPHPPCESGCRRLSGVSR